ncbi:MAG: ABC transporter ATP-binding protein [Lachnospiraceae bacterium]|nr:ABC transporter ATP-binding protein [Lachnospiraceae bacterium]
MELAVKEICKSYGEKAVLKDFSYTFARNHITCILGESGRGKTTLLRILMGLEQKDAGEIIGFEKIKRSAVFQEDRLCKNLSAVANIKLVCSRDITKEEVMENLERVGLADSADQPVQELSGGMQRRVAIVRALMAEYDVLFMDEPLKGLDADTKEQVTRYLLEKTAGKTVIMITHEPEEVVRLNAVELKM